MKAARLVGISAATIGKLGPTLVATQAVGNVRYFDAAGYPGRTIGLPGQANAGKAD